MSSEALFFSSPESALSLFTALVSGRITPNATWQSSAYRAKFLLRSLAFPHSTALHMRQLADIPAMREALVLQPMLPGKVHRPYLHLGLSATQRARTIGQHYRFMQQLTAGVLRQALLSPHSTELVSFYGKDDQPFRVTVACNGRCEREGEVVMLLSSGEVTLAVLTFAITEQRSQPVLVIGCVQGAHRDTPHEAIRLATKACYGLFPKRLLLEVAFLLARELGISTLQGVSDCSHTWRSLRYRFKKKEAFVASYDEFWQSLDASRLSRQLWQLPAELAHKAMEEIPSKKRAEYRRRYQLLDDLHQQFSRFA